MPAPRCCPSAAVAVANLVAEAAHGKPAVLGFKSHKKQPKKWFGLRKLHMDVLNTSFAMQTAEQKM